MKRSIQELAKEALDVQNACNPLGVTKSFAEAVQAVFDHEETSMSALSYHPVVILWVYKVADLFGKTIEDQESYSEALQQCKILSQQCRQCYRTLSKEEQENPNTQITGLCRDCWC